jgi:hypothetical protein
MKYAKQAQTALNRLDVSLAKLRTLIKRGQTKEALQFMEQGEMKENWESLQNMITISQVGTLGARGTQNPGSL